MQSFMNWKLKLLQMQVRIQLLRSLPIWQDVEPILNWIQKRRLLVV